MTEQTYREMDAYMRRRYGIPANEIDRPKANAGDDQAKADA